MLFSKQWSGESVSGKCPGGTNFKCCLSGSGGSSSGGDSLSECSFENSFYGPCRGGWGACVDISVISCDTSTINGKCPGGTSVICCVAGGRPSWYINQNEYITTVWTIGGKAKSVKTSGCGAVSLPMAIGALTEIGKIPQIYSKKHLMMVNMVEVV